MQHHIGQKLGTPLVKKVPKKSYTLLARPWRTSYDSTTHIIQSESREFVNQDATPMERWSQEQLA